MSADTAAVLAAITRIRMGADALADLDGAECQYVRDARALADVAEAAARLRAAPAWIMEHAGWWYWRWDDAADSWQCIGCDGYKPGHHAADCPAVAIDAALARLAEEVAG